MSCSNLQGVATLVTGNPGFIDYRTAPLSTFANFSCQNTTKGPNISLKCDDCQLISDNLYISWQFVDLPNIPAAAVGFEFKLTARDRRHKKHMSFVSGSLKNGSTNSAKFVTYRGRDSNILKFDLFPRIYRNKHDLKLIQPLFHDFLPGSSFSETSELRSSMQRSTEGLVNTTLYVNFLSSYIVEIDNQSTLGPVGFLADLGGLYCVSIGIFFYFLVQLEYRFKRFRHEDGVMISIRNRRKAQERWNKLRKYVCFTWGGGILPSKDVAFVEKASCSCFAIPRNRRKLMRTDNVNVNTKHSTPDEKGLRDVKCGVEKNGNCSIHSNNADTARQQFLAAAAADIPLPPLLEIRPGSKISVSEIQKNLQNVYEYNMMLREKLAIAQSAINALTSKASSSSSSS